MKNHIMRFVPNPPKPGKGITHIQCLESSARMNKETAEGFRVRCHTILLNKAGRWEGAKYGNNVIHPEGMSLITNKINALNEKRPLDEGGDPSAEETWQHDVGLVEQNGKTFHELKTAN